jgi:hypothetical protein
MVPWTRFSTANRRTEGRKSIVLANPSKRGARKGIIIMLIGKGKALELDFEKFSTAFKSKLILHKSTVPVVRRCCYFALLCHVKQGK